MLVLSYDNQHNYMAIMIMVFVSIMAANQGMFLLVMAFSFLAAQIVSKQVAIKIIEVIFIKVIEVIFVIVVNFILIGDALSSCHVLHHHKVSSRSSASS